MSRNASPQRRLGFAGTPDFAAHILENLLQSNVRPEVVLTQPDRPRGRGRRIQPSAVKQLASAWGLAVRQPENLTTPASWTSLQDLDLLIVAAYGLLLPPQVLAMPRLGCINVHASLLPRWRGAAPIERALMAGDDRSGITLMQMDQGLDTGDIVACAECLITDSMTGDELHDALAQLASELLIACLPDIEHRPRLPQSKQGVTYASKLSESEAELDWHDTAKNIVNRIRALNSRMPAFSYLDADGRERVRILSARRAKPGTEPDSPHPAMSATAHRAGVGTILYAGGNTVRVRGGDGCIDIHQIQLSRGKARVMPIAAALNGYPDLFRPGKTFSSKHQKTSPNDA